MPQNRTRNGKQISVRVPDFAKEALDELPDAVVAGAPADKRPSQPELVAALVATAKADAAVRALRTYRKELAARGLANFHRR
jgi:hypothetical protein